MVDTNISYFAEDVGKNLYRKKTYYTVVIEQEVLAKDKDEADTLFLDNGGIKHSAVNTDITETNNGVETLYVDADYSDSGETEYVGKVVYDDTEFAKEDGDVVIDTLADEVIKTPYTANEGI